MSTHIVIMAGGVGSRLYPLSTPERPKQFIDILDCGLTLIQLTYARFKAVDPQAKFWVVTSEQYIHFVKEQIPDISDHCILAEPCARNTAPAIAYACWKIKQRYPDANVVVTPADAYVPDLKAFAATIRTALDFASQQTSVVCTGIRPASPHTGYGYIHADAKHSTEVVPVIEFKEKPSLEVAQRYLQEGGYWWNAGIFVWTAASIEKEIRAYAPGLASIMDQLADSFYTDGEVAELQRLFPQCEKISIDYAVMEKSKQVYMIPGNWEWSDLGSFEAIEAITGKKFK